MFWLIVVGMGMVGIMIVLFLWLLVGIVDVDLLMVLGVMVVFGGVVFVVLV